LTGFSAVPSSAAICLLRRAQGGLQLEPVDLRHDDVEQQAAGRFRVMCGKELLRRAEHADVEARGTEQARQRAPNLRIVVDDEDLVWPSTHESPLDAPGTRSWVGRAIWDQRPIARY
jgi:hypothetical protein